MSKKGNKGKKVTLDPSKFVFKGTNKAMSKFKRDVEAQANKIGDVIDETIGTFTVKYGDKKLTAPKSWFVFEPEEFAKGGQSKKQKESIRIVKEKQFDWNEFEQTTYKRLKEYFKAKRTYIQVWKNLSLGDTMTNYVYRAELKMKSVAEKPFEILITYYRGQNTDSFGEIVYNIKEDKFTPYFPDWGFNGDADSFDKGGKVEKDDSVESVGGLKIHKGYGSLLDDIHSGKKSVVRKLMANKEFFEKGGVISNKMKFTESDYKKLVGTPFTFYSTKNGSFWEIKEEDTEQIVALWNKKHQILTLKGERGRLIDWLRQNSYISSSNFSEGGSPMGSTMQEHIPTSFEEGGDIDENKFYRGSLSRYTVKNGKKVSAIEYEYISLGGYVDISNRIKDFTPVAIKYHTGENDIFGKTFYAGKVERFSFDNGKSKGFKIYLEFPVNQFKDVKGMRQIAISNVGNWLRPDMVEFSEGGSPMGSTIQNHIETSFAAGGLAEANEKIEQLREEYNRLNGKMTYGELSEREAPYRNVVNEAFLKRNKDYEVVWTSKDESGNIINVFLKAPKEFEDESHYLSKINNTNFFSNLTGTKNIEDEIRHSKKIVKNKTFESIPSVQERYPVWIQMLKTKKEFPYIEFMSKSSQWHYNENKKQSFSTGGHIYSNPDITLLVISKEYPLSTQLEHLTGNSWNAIDFDGSTKAEEIITHKQTGRKFTVLNEKEAEDLGLSDLRIYSEGGSPMGSTMQEHIPTSFAKGGNTSSVPEIVLGAMVNPITDIGQLTKEDVRNLNKYVAKGVLIKGKGGPFPKIKTVYAISGFDIQADRKEQIDVMLKEIEQLEPGKVIRFNHGGSINDSVYNNPDITILIISKEYPLSTQLEHLTGNSWNVIDFDGSTKAGEIITHKQTGRKFTVLNEKEAEDLGLSDLRIYSEGGSPLGSTMQTHIPTLFANGGKANKGAKKIEVNSSNINEFKKYQGVTKKLNIGDALYIVNKGIPYPQINESFVIVTDWEPSTNTLEMIKRKDDIDAKKYGWVEGAKLYERIVKEKKDSVYFNRWSINQKFI